MNTPHTHPRATEILYSVNGTLTSGTIGENGSRFVFNNINPGQATVFPLVCPVTIKVRIYIEHFAFRDPSTTRRTRAVNQRPLFVSDTQSW